MAHIIQCRICQMKFDTEKRDDWVMPSQGWYYHRSCYDDFVRREKTLADVNAHIEVDDDMWRNAVYDYLKKDLKMPLDFIKFLSQWSNFLKKNMTAKGIYFTLRYFYEIARGDKTKSENGIGIVPYVYKEATSYWGERNQREQGICERIMLQVQEHISKKPVIVQRTRQNNAKRESLVNWDFMNEDDDDGDQ